MGLPHWGPRREVRGVARQYGIYHKKQTGSDVDHTFLTSPVDQRGTLRVQYMGVRFDSDELRRDLQSLLRGGARAMRDRLVRLVARVPAPVQAKLLAAFLAIVVLLIVVGAVSLRVLSEVNRRGKELVMLHRKIAAYR